jgi:hypothetical protein
MRMRRLGGEGGGSCGSGVVALLSFWGRVLTEGWDRCVPGVQSEIWAAVAGWDVSGSSAVAVGPE